MSRLIASLLAALLLAACAQMQLPPAALPAPCPPCQLCSPRPACPPCPVAELPPPRVAAKPFEAAQWTDLPAWGEDNPAPALAALLSSCKVLHKRDIWSNTCAAARDLEQREDGQNEASLRAWFETQFRPWQLVNPDGTREGTITGYYEPVLKGSRKRHAPYLQPVFGEPADMIEVALAELYPELRHMRLRGRIEGRRLVPYYSRGEWEEQQRAQEVLLWIDDPIDVFFMHIQGSGQVMLDDGSRVRLNYANQNGHPYRSIGRWLIDQGELKASQASMQGIKAWARANPKRLQQLLNVNPSYVFFRELPLEGIGPPGAMGLALTPERSIAVDPRITPLGAPVWLATTYPNSEQPLNRLMLAQDTGGAIRGPVRADFFWGSGDEAGSQAGKMRQKGRMWLLLPRNHDPLTGAK